MGKFFCLIGLLVVILAGCKVLDDDGNNVQKGGERAFVYEEYKHPEKVEEVDISRIVSLYVKNNNGSWQIFYDPLKDSEEFYSPWVVAAGYQSLRMADISKVREAFEAVVNLMRELAGKSPEEEGDISITVFYQKAGEEEVSSCRIAVDDLPVQAKELEHLTAFDMILKLPVIESLDDLKYVELICGKEKIRLRKKQEDWFLGREKIEEKRVRRLYQEIMGILLGGELEEKEKKMGSEEMLLTVRYVRKAGDVVEVGYLQDVNEHSRVRIDGVEEFWVWEKDVRKVIEEIW